MRKVAKVQKTDCEARWVIIFESEGSTYLFPCDSDLDGSARFDEWYESLAEADQACWEEYGIGPQDWIAVPDPLPGCQHNWVSPVRVNVGDRDAPEWGSVERLIDGTWVPIDTENGPPEIMVAIRESLQT